MIPNACQVNALKTNLTHDKLPSSGSTFLGTASEIFIWKKWITSHKPLWRIPQYGIIKKFF